jgi:integrase
LEKVGVVYRFPRNSRHSFVSNALDQGVNPAHIADMTGHSEETLFKHYVGSVRDRPKLPVAVSVANELKRPMLLT